MQIQFSVSLHILINFYRENWQYLIGIVTDIFWTHYEDKFTRKRLNVGNDQWRQKERAAKNPMA